MQVSDVADTVFLFDVDNTLLDNDRVAEELRQHLATQLGDSAEHQYWVLFEEVRSELGYADYLGALQRYRMKYPYDNQLREISSFLLNYPFEERLFPRALEVLEAFADRGTVTILTDGDVVFQPHKIERSGIGRAVRDHVMLYVHKEQELADVEARYPAEHYVLIDDKVRILASVKAQWGSRVTTVFPRQGHYALDAESVAKYPPPDCEIDHIADLLALDAFGPVR